MKTKRKFPTAVVLGAQSGIMLEEKGIGRIHELFDHLFPGVMMGFSFLAVAPRVKEELLRQVPLIGALGECGKGVHEDFLRRALLLFGPEIEVEGPL